MVSPPDRDFSELSPIKQPLSREWGSQIDREDMGEHLERHHHECTVTPLQEPQCRLFVWIHVSFSIRRSCFTLCESPSAENWRTVALAFMCLLLCEWGYQFNLLYLFRVCFLHVHLQTCLLKQRFKQLFLFTEGFGVCCKICGVLVEPNACEQY